MYIPLVLNKHLHPSWESDSKATLPGLEAHKDGTKSDGQQHLTSLLRYHPPVILSLTITVKHNYTLRSKCPLSFHLSDPASVCRRHLQVLPLLFRRTLFHRTCARTPIQIHICAQRTISRSSCLQHFEGSKNTTCSFIKRKTCPLILTSLPQSSLSSPQVLRASPLWKSRSTSQN